MPRNLLLLSNSTLHGTEYLQFAAQHIQSFLEKFNVKRVLFIPYALHNYDQYEKKVQEPFKKLGLELQSIHHSGDNINAVSQAEAIYVGGGNTFRLLNTLYNKNLIEAIRKRILSDGIPYIGASAGTNVATVSICTTNDMPIVYPPSFAALCLVPFNINPHYLDPDPSSKHMGETRGTRIKEYHEIHGTPPVVGLREGSFLHVIDNKITLHGLQARIFKPGEEPCEYEDGSDLSFLMS